MGDGWTGEETALNKMGQFIVGIPAVIGAIVMYWTSEMENFPVEYVFIVVGICGLLGGAVNVYGRGPEAAGAFVGLVMGIGGLLACYYWMQFRDEGRMRIWEFFIAFVVGAIPGFIVQFAIQRILGWKGGEAEEVPVKKKAMRRV
jgi:hypothetical protein